MIDFYEHIEAYIEGTLSPDLVTQMKTAISKDNSLKQAVADYPIAKTLSESLIEHEVREILSETKTTDNEKGRSGAWIIAITLLAALAVSYYQWNRHNHQEIIHNRIMASYTPPVSEGTRSSTSVASESNLKSAVQAFDLRQFDQSKEILEKLSPKNDSIYYYLAHIALIENKIGKAKSYERKISTLELKKDLTKYLSEF